MTPQEAIEWLDKAKGHAEALKMAKEALGKKAPKKPNKSFLPIGGYECPSCGIWAGTCIFEEYCHACGQHLDWKSIRQEPVKENTIPVEALEDYIEKRVRGVRIERKDEK